MKHAIISIEDRRFYTNSGVDLRGIARAAVQDVTQQAGRPGRVDDPAAVREDLARRRERAHGLPEAARGRARLPPHAHVVQGADPAQLPELDLLRQRRLRDRVGRAHLLHLQPRRLRRAARPAAVRVGPAARTRPRCWPAMVASPSAYRPDRSTRSRPSAGATSCCCACSSRATSRARCTTRRARPLPTARRPDLPEGGHGVPVLHLLDQAAGRRPARRRPAGRAAARSRAG